MSANVDVCKYGNNIQLEHNFNTGLRRIIGGREPWMKEDSSCCPRCRQWWSDGWLVALFRRMSHRAKLPPWKKVENLHKENEEKLKNGRETDNNIIWAQLQSFFLSPNNTLYFADFLRLNIAAFTFANPKEGKLRYPLKEVKSIFLPFLYCPQKSNSEKLFNKTASKIKICPVFSRFKEIEEKSFSELIARISSFRFITTDKVFKNLCNEIIKHRNIFEKTANQKENTLLSFIDTLSNIKTSKDSLFEKMLKQEDFNDLLKTLHQTWKKYLHFWKNKIWKEAESIYGCMQSNSFFHVLFHQQIFNCMHETYGLIISRASTLDDRLEVKPIEGYEQPKYLSYEERREGIVINEEWESVLRLLKWLSDLKRNRNDIDLLIGLNLLDHIDGVYKFTQKFDRIKQKITTYKKNTSIKQSTIRILEYVNEIFKTIDEKPPKSNSEFEEFASLLIWKLSSIPSNQAEELLSRPFPHIRLVLELGSSEISRNEIAVGLNVPTNIGLDDIIKGYYFADIDFYPQPVNRKRFQQLVNKHSDIASRLGLLILQPLYEKILLEEKEKSEAKLKQLATRAAISQVMARNLSHNIGSHVLSKYKSVADFVGVEQYALTGSEYEKKKSTNSEETKINKKTRRRQYLASGLNFHINIKCVHKNDSKNESLSNPHWFNCPDCRKMIAEELHAVFNEYLKNRTDFLADIATIDHPTLETALKFKEDILSGFDKNRILLNLISGVDAGFVFDILLKLPDNKDVDISIPNGVLGCQAFYTILENVIRNIAKHSKLPKDEKLIISIDVLEYEHNTRYWELMIYDSVKDDEREINNLVKTRNALFNSSILIPDKSIPSEPTYRLRDTGLGSIEMDVCSVYLRKQSLIKVEDEFYGINKNHYKKDKNLKIPNLIYAYSQPIENGKYSLGYKMYLRKPQILLIVDDNNLLGKKKNETIKLFSKGIQIIKTSEFEAQEEYGHDFIIWLNNETEFPEFYKKHKNILPIRVLKISDFENSRFELSEDIFKVEEGIWETYTKKVWKEKAISDVNLTKGKWNYPSSTENRDENSRKIFIDNHNDEWVKLKNSDVYYEMCCSHHTLKRLNLRSNSVDRNRYFETVFTSVILIDERIQSNVVNSQKDYGGNLLFKEYFEQMGIFIPTGDDADLNSPNFGELSALKNTDSNIAHQLKSYLERKINKVDFCVIHLGIIEKLFGKNETKSPTRVLNKIELLVGKNNLDKVIITSGRGKPTNLEDKFRYVPLAVIQNHVETLFDKFLLVNALFSSRKSK